MKKVISAILFVAIAVVSGSIVSVYWMDKNLTEAKNAAQVEIVETVQAETEFLRGSGVYTDWGA